MTPSPSLPLFKTHVLRNAVLRNCYILAAYANTFVGYLFVFVAFCYVNSKNLNVERNLLIFIL